MRHSKIDLLQLAGRVWDARRNQVLVLFADL